MSRAISNFFCAKHRPRRKSEEQLRQEYEARRQKACSSKDKLTMNAARQRARSLTMQLNESFGYYECEYCGHWHVGHS